MNAHTDIAVKKDLSRLWQGPFHAGDIIARNVLRFVDGAFVTVTERFVVRYCDKRVSGAEKDIVCGWVWVEGRENPLPLQDFKLVEVA